MFQLDHYFMFLPFCLDKLKLPRWRGGSFRPSTLHFINVVAAPFGTL